MEAGGQDGRVSTWQSVVVDKVEEEEVSRMAYVTYSRHVAMRRRGQHVEFAHIWTAGTTSLDQGHRDDVPVVILPVGSPMASRGRLDDLTALVTGLAQCRDAVEAAIRQAEEPPRE